MIKRRYTAPLLMESSGENPTVIGQGTGQGTNTPEGTSYDVWFEDIACGYTGPVGEAPNPDADHNGDGVVNRDDYDYYIANELWNG